MTYVRILVMLLSSSACVIFETVHGSKQKVLSDLRQFKAVGVGGRFVVKRDALERELWYRKQQDALCRQNVKLQLPKCLPHAAYQTSNYGEVAIFYETITDHTLAAELSDDLKNRVATSYQFLAVVIPVIVGSAENNGILCLHLFTNSTMKVLHPQFTTIGGGTYVEIVEMEDEGTVTLRLGDDVMAFQVNDTANDLSEGNVGGDFDKVIGKVISSTNYPMLFDWGCNILSSNISFCQDFKKVQPELAAVKGDVCALTSTSVSNRSPTSMVVVNMTGIFRDMFPYLAETVPSESFEAEKLHREHTTGIAYPCLNF